MTENDRHHDRFLAYQIAALLLGLGGFLALVGWIIIAPFESVAHDEKVWFLLFLIVLPGSYILKRLCRRYSIPTKWERRLSVMAFVGLTIGLLETESAQSPIDAIAVFALYFICASLAFLFIDTAFDWVWAKRKKRRPKPPLQ